MNKEDEFAPVVTADVYELAAHYLEQSKGLLSLARENISLSEQLTALWLRKGSKYRRTNTGRILSRNKKALNVSLSEIDKLIKRIELDCDNFLENSILDDDDSVISGD